MLPVTRCAFMKYVIFSDRGKQYKASESQEILIDSLNSKDGDKVEFENILLYVDGDEVKVGNPAVPGVKILCNVIGKEKGEKIKIAKYKAKSRYRRVTGHRSIYTRVKIEKITLGK